jgi:hypothetical protein
MVKVKVVRRPSIKLNEDVTIPPELSTQYLTVKKQISDKQSKKDQIMKAVNQIENEMNILNRNLIAIETKAAQMQGQQQAQQVQQEKKAQAAQGQGEVQVTESEDLDDLWKEYIKESIDEEEPDIDLAADDIEDDTEDEDLADEPEETGDSLEGDYVFALKIIDSSEEEDIIAKFYKDEDDDYWKARVVQGSEEPIESMQFDPDMEMIDIIEHLATMFDEVEEVDVDDYEEMLDDKEKVDDIFYDDIIK